MAKLTYSIIGKSCNKLLIGKTFWKAVVLPGLLIGNSVIVWNKKELNKLQSIENSVWRKILGANKYAANVTLQGEIGSSTSQARDMKAKINYANHMSNSQNELIKQLYEELSNDPKPSSWISTTKKYAQELNLTMKQIPYLSKNQINLKIKNWEHQKWRQDVEDKKTLKYYKYKQQIRDEGLYENDYGSILLYRCRSNTLKLNWRNIFTGADVKCFFCDEEESLEHFLKDCPEYKQIREAYKIDDSTDVTQILMFMCEDKDKPDYRYKEFIQDIWKRRSERKEE